MFLTGKPDVLGWVIMTIGNEVRLSNAVGERNLKATITRHTQEEVQLILVGRARPSWSVVAE